RSLPLAHRPPVTELRTPYLHVALPIFADVLVGTSAPERHLRFVLGANLLHGQALVARILLVQALLPEGSVQQESLYEQYARNQGDRKSKRLNSSHEWTSYAVVFLRKNT